MGRATGRTKNRIHSHPEQLVVALQCEENALQRAAVELDLCFDPVTDSSRTAPSTPQLNGRLANWEKLCQRYSSSVQISTEAGLAAGAQVEGSSSSMSGMEWTEIQVC